MQNPLYLNLNREDFEHIARALAVYDHVRHRNRERKHAAGAEVSELQERWLDEGERFGAPLTDEERDRLLDDAFKEIDDVVKGRINELKVAGRVRCGGYVISVTKRAGRTVEEFAVKPGKIIRIKAINEDAE